MAYGVITTIFGLSKFVNENFGMKLFQRRFREDVEDIVKIV